MKPCQYIRYMTAVPIVMREKNFLSAQRQKRRMEEQALRTTLMKPEVACMKVDPRIYLSGYFIDGRRKSKN